jgi:hypothetical protein
MRRNFLSSLQATNGCSFQTIALGQLKRKKGEAINVEPRESKKMKKPSKCWYCTERHFGNDPVCPIARSDPEKWVRFTKKVGGWRGKVQGQPTFKAKHVVFDD